MINDSQMGFTKKARTSDHTFILKTIIDKYCNNKEMARTKRRIDVRNKSSLVNVTFHAAPKIDKGYKHTVILKVQGSHGYYGASGRSNLQLHGSASTCVNPEGDFTKVIMRKDQVPALLVKPIIRS